MRLVGLSATEFSLLFSLAAFLAVVLYIIPHRRRVALMSTEPLWQKVLGPRRTPLRKLLSLVGQILILFMLSLALADPRFEKADVGPRVMQVVAVDVSASMARLQHNRSGLQRAISLVMKLSQAMGPRDRLMLLAMADTCQPLTDFTGDVQKIERVLQKLETFPVEQNFAQTLRFATNALAAHDLSVDDLRRVVIVSDHFYQVPDPADSLSHRPSKRNAGNRKKDSATLVGLPQTKILQVAVLKPTPNVALSAFDVRTRPQTSAGSQVFVQIANYSRTDRRVKLLIHTESVLLGEELFRLPPLAEQSRSYFLKPIATQKLMATIVDSDRGGADRFSLDDRLYVLVPVQHAHKVVLVTSGNLYLEKALALSPNVALKVIGSSSFQSDQLRGYDAVVFDGICPKTSLPAIYFDLPASIDCPFAALSKVEFPKLQPLFGDHPITFGLTLIDVQIQSAKRLVPLGHDVELLSDDLGPIALARETNNTKLVGFGFDLSKSDLPLRVAFPLLIHNCLVWLLGEPNEFQMPLRLLGQQVRLPNWASGANTLITGPNNLAYASLSIGDRLYLDYDQPGFYQVQNGDFREMLALNFISPEESAMDQPRRLGPDRIEYDDSLGPADVLLAGFDKRQHTQSEPQWPSVLLAGVWLLLFDWIFYCFRMLF